ncbi:MAG TPA: hypothetical protein VEC99_14025 [Clostridia bacterium]|nr:hypothetical protein [Clostridia bacterium]
MNADFDRTAEQAAAFQKMWMDSASKMMQAVFTSTPNSPTPETIRQMRSGIFQALASSWDEFLRTPQFQDSMKQWMENAINFRKMTSDFMAKARNEMQAPSRDDVDTILLNVRHMEKRLLDRIEELALQVDQLQERLGVRKAPTKKPTPKAKAKITEQRIPTSIKTIP